MRLGYVAAAAVIPLLCLGVLSPFRTVEADGAIGCLFSKAVCKPQLEWCFNDNAFGRCLEPLSKEVQLDLYQYKLDKGSLHLLIKELERLLNLGYHWNHLYTQCVLKNLLSSVREEKKYDSDACKELIDEDLKGALKAFDSDDDNELDPKNMARVKFLPSFVNPHGDYADEIYIPIIGSNGELLDPERFGKDPDKEKPNYIADLRRALIKDLESMQKRSKIQKRHRFENRLQKQQDDVGSPYGIEYIKSRVDELPEMNGKYEKPKIHFTERYNTPDNFRRGFESRDYNKIPGEKEELLDSLIRNEGSVTSFLKDYNTPEKFRYGMESRDNVEYPGKAYLGWDNAKFGSIPEEREYLYETFKNEEGVYNDQPGEEPAERVYTEGGFLHVKDESKDDDPENSMDDYNAWGFKRRERLDVKKPGPPYKTNNYAFKIDETETETDKDNTKGEEAMVESTPPKSKEANLKMPEKKKFGTPVESALFRKQTTSMPEELTNISEDPVDTSYAFIQFKDRVSTWQEGARIVRGVEELLKLDLNTFSHTRVDQNEVTFKVEPNRMNLNASEVAKRIDANREKIKKILAVDVTSTGVGDKAKLPTVMNLSTMDEHQLWILSFLLCGVIGAIAIAGAAFFVIRRHSRTRQKLQNLTQLDSEVSKDYQDLCRARMATKSPQEKTEGGVVGHRITSLARESEGSNHSPSSRSSTSSWSEEPALTNMDISTGHIVLSYMEDHLKNKDRLEQEWIALCAYEAEPCATVVAVKEENAKKNRYNDILPYDHARVILNELSNISGSDYINASTITDHDPRNPAYIATQGPLQQTSADFWQMVWEQGSVVMVMLTRLTENGLAMCHRYWPEEGSDLYHIYEVHLVSEHIWCDDYLVRSFYLKNVKTGETRTVTQFHFLSWPENGVPLSTKALLEFRRKVNKSYRGRSCPIVVHCSDGVGRTGTYCLIDMVLNRMAKGAKEIDIAATLEHIRDQRPLMVRTKQQFEFVLMAIAEEVHAILKALPANHSPPPVSKEKD